MTNHIEESARPLIICPTCEGHGVVAPGFVYTQDDIMEQFGGFTDEYYEHMENLRDGLFDRTCHECGGRRVVISDCECPECDEARMEIAEMEAMRRAEIAAGC